MADEPTWEGLAKGLLVLGVLWWSWVGYAWLTSVVDPEEGAVRLAIFAAMAALLVVALCVPGAFGDDGAAVRRRLRRRARARTSCLFVARQPRRPRPAPVGRRARGEHGDRHRAARRRVVHRRDARRARCGRSRCALDMGGPYFFGAERLAARARPLRRAPRADRDHRAGRVDRRDRRRRRGAASTPASSSPPCSASSSRPRCGGCTSTSSRSSPSGGWTNAPPGRERNEIARDSFSYLHFPMVAGIVLRRARPQEDARPRRRPAEARPGRRAARRHRALPARPRRVPLAQRPPLQQRSAWSPRRCCVALIPAAVELPALATLAIARRGARAC